MANIQQIDIVAPGAFGLNTEAANTLLQPQWATKALNAVINRAGRIAARRGWQDQTAVAIAGTPNIETMHEYLNRAGASEFLSAAGNKIFKGINDFTVAANDITSTTAPTANHWQFINFNGKVLGFQKGHTPIERSTADFVDAVYTGTGPDGNAALAAFGRVWAASADLQTLRFSALLDDTDYTTASGGGFLDLSTVWTNGMDQIVAIAAIGANLVVFGRNHIIMWADGSGSELGLDPTNLEVVDTIEGTGCIARDSVANTGEGDLIFLSRHGLQSLGRVIQQKSNPVKTLSKSFRSNILSAIALQRTADSQFDQVRAIHSAEEGLYILNLPAVGKMFVLDTEHPFRDDFGDTLFPGTEWLMGGDIRALLDTQLGDVLLGSAGVVGQYGGQSDNGVGYDFEFSTGWLDFDQLNHRLKMLKELIGSVTIGNGQLVWTWEFDFNGTQLTRVVSYTGSAAAEWGVAEYNIAEYSGGVILQRRLIPAHGEGQFLRVGVTARVNGFDIVLQHMSVAPKIGRLVT